MPNYKVGGKTGLAIDMESSWDAGEARAKVWTWAGWDGDKAPSKDGGKTRQAFVLYDADAADAKGGYKLPFATVKGGNLQAVANGVRNAKSRIEQVDGLSEAVKKDGIALLDSYMAKIQEKGKEADAGRQLWVAPATIVRVGQESLLAIAKDKHAFDEKIFEESPPFFWRTMPSNQQMDAYGTRMMDDTLKNFADDAENGVAFLASHDTDYLPFGRSITGKYYDGRSNAGKRMEADFYTIPGLETGKVTSDAFIRGVRSGILHDVSVGFYGGEIRCSVCESPMFPFFGRIFSRCDHVPGLMYYKKNKDGSDSDTKVMATGDIYGAHLAEVSSVYDGATPGAAIIGVARAMGLADEGLLRPEHRAFVESHFRTKLPGMGRVWPGSDDPAREDADDPNPGGTRMPPDDEALQTARAQGNTAALDQVRSWLQASGLAPAKDWDRDIERTIRGVGTDLTRLRPLAADGERYKADLITDALAEGVRALGDGFSRETYEPILKGASIDAVKRMRDDWKAQADKILQTGRGTVDDPARPGGNGTSAFKPPRSAHAG